MANCVTQCRYTFEPIRNRSSWSSYWSSVGIFSPPSSPSKLVQSCGFLGAILGRSDGCCSPRESASPHDTDSRLDPESDLVCSPLSASVARLSLPCILCDSGCASCLKLLGWARLSMLLPICPDQVIGMSPLRALIRRLE